MEHLLSLDEVAQQLAVPVGTLRYWRHRNDGPRSLKVGRHVRYRPADIEAWLEMQGNPAA